MKSCNKVNEWLEQEPPPDVKAIPANIAEHIEICPACRETVAYFRRLTRDDQFPRLSSRETGEFMQKFEKNALEASPFTESSLRSPAKTTGWPFMTWIVAGAFVLLLLVFGASWVFPGGPFGMNRNHGAVAILRGNVALRSADGKTANVGDAKEQGLAQDAGFTFDEKSGPVEMQFREGGNVYLTGLGEIHVQKEGFRIARGEFDATFKNLRGVMKVRVPGAVLGVRGTIIRFVIRPSLVMIQLIEGAADLIPDDVTAKPIHFTVGVFLRLSGKAWSMVRGDIRRDGLHHGPDRMHDGEHGKLVSQSGPNGQAIASGSTSIAVTASSTVVDPASGTPSVPEDAAVASGTASEQASAPATPGDGGGVASDSGVIETPPVSDGPGAASDPAPGNDDDLIGREGFQSN